MIADEPFSSLSIFDKYLFNPVINNGLTSEVSVIDHGIDLVRNERMNQLLYSSCIASSKNILV